MEFDHQEGLARALFEESGDVLFLIDPDTDAILDANAKAQRLTGLPIRELLRMPLDHLLRFGGPGGLKQMRQAASKSGTFHSREGYFLRTASSEAGIPVNLTISRLHLKPKTLALITARDMREQQATYDQLQQAEKELRRVLASVSDCLWTAEIDGTGQWVYRYISPAVEKITGQPPTYFLAGLHRWWSLIHPEDQPRWEKAVVRLRAGQPTQEEYRLHCPDGSYRWVRESTQASQVENGHALQLHGMVSDLTERKQAEEQLRVREERLGAFLGACPVLAFLKEPGGRFVYVNEPLVARAGKTAAEALCLTDAELFPPEVGGAWARHGQAALAAGRPIQAIEVIKTSAGGSGRWLVVAFSVPTGKAQRLLGGLLADLTGLVAPEPTPRPA
jgi:PAS domain S-box-containing protein